MTHKGKPPKVASNALSEASSKGYPYLDLDGGKVMEKAQESKTRAMCASDWIRVPIAPGRYFVYLVIVGVV